MKTNTTESSSKIRKNVESRSRGRRAIVSVVGALILTTGVGSFATAVGILHVTPSASTIAPFRSSTISPLTSPNEAAAPGVPTPGGATEGSGNFNAVSCPSAKYCVAVGGDNSLRGVVAISTDRGLGWKDEQLSAPVAQLDAVTCESAKSCVAVGEGAIETSANAGVSWTPRELPSANTTLLGVSCPTATKCVAVGVSPGNAGPLVGELLVSGDGGATWATPTLPGNVGALGSVECPTASFCVAVGSQILVSDDGGATWMTRAVNGGTNVLRSVSCSSPTVCVALGANPIGAINPAAGAFEATTTDGGATWTAVTTPAGSASLVAISCATGNACTAAGVSDTGTAPVFSSNDGGVTWTKEMIPGSVTAVSTLRCRTGTDCVFVGRQGKKPTSGDESSGASWNVATISTPALAENVGA
jgi:hypothetical protein